MGKGPRGKPAASNTLGFERKILFKELKNRFPDLFKPGNRNPIITEAIANRFPEFRPYIGEKLIEHHLAHGYISYPLPESIHRSMSSYLHGTATNVGQ